MYSSDDVTVSAQKTSDRIWAIIASSFSIESSDAVKNDPKVLYAWILIKVDSQFTHVLSFNSRPASFKSAERAEHSANSQYALRESSCIIRATFLDTQFS